MKGRACPWLYDCLVCYPVIAHFKQDSKRKVLLILQQAYFITLAHFALTTLGK
jgi:hypothetical protein